MKSVVVSLLLTGALGSVTLEPEFDLVEKNIPVVGDVAHDRMVKSMMDKEAYWEEKQKTGKWATYDSALNQRVTCPGGDNGGSVSINGEGFPCRNIDFESFLSLSQLSISGNSGTTAGSDIWGWRDPNGREITIMCVNNGVWFIDGTNPSNPGRLAYITSGRPRAAWCDVKVYQNTAYIVKDGGPSNNYGIEVFNLLRLNSLSGNTLQSLSPDFVYAEHGPSHNLAIDTESGFLYSVGTNTCSGGLHMISLANRLRPTFAGCASSDGYTHDAQCVVYRGPDSTYTGRQICFAYNEDTLTIWDVTNKNSPVVIGRQGYSGSRYTHQGWLSNDMSYVLLNDELDESQGSVSRTTTYMFDVSDLNNPVFRQRFSSSQVSPDHNLYVWGAIHRRGWGGNSAISANNAPDIRFAYLSNYIAGIRVLDISNLPSVSEVGFFDVAPDINQRNVFDGTWSNYMHPSGVLAVSSIDRGLFFLTPRMAFGSSNPSPSPSPSPSPGCSDSVPSGITVGGVPTPCPELDIYCSGYDFVREACPVTCGTCTSAKAVVVKDSVASGSNADAQLYTVIGLSAVCVALIAMNVKRSVKKLEVVGSSTDVVTDVELNTVPAKSAQNPMTN